MSWCDKLSSVPTVGITMSPMFITSDRILDLMGPLLSSNLKGSKYLFDVQAKDAASVTIAFHDGFSYSIDPARVSVGFAHRFQVVNTSGSRPALNYLTDIKRFSELLPECATRLLDFVSLLPGSAERRVSRTGVVATTIASLEDVPPGLQRLVAYLGSPWGTLSALATQIVANIHTDERWNDRCSHQIIIAEESEMIPQFIFDWQREFKSPSLFRSDNVARLLMHSARDAQKYLEYLGEQGFESAT